MRKLLLATTAAAFVASAGSAMAASADFTASATTQAGIAVSCSANLAFGTLGVEAGNTESTVTVGASSGATASVDSGTGVTALGTSNPAACAVTNETGGDATAALSATTIELSDGAATPTTLSATLNLSKASAIGNETLYIGGTLTIPVSHTTFATYTSSAVTLTVTD